MTLELSTGVDRLPNRLDYCTKIAACPCAKPGTLHPLWDAFLARVTDNNHELIGFLQRYLGYCMTGHTREHVLLFLYGTGANGKGVFVNTVSRIFGDYAMVAPMDLFMASKHERHPTEIAKLRGVRLIVAQERPPLGHDQDQDADERRQADRPVHAAGFFRLHPDPQADHHRQPQAQPG
jgi:putative DNA primase/helicase